MSKKLTAKPSIAMIAIVAVSAVVSSFVASAVVKPLFRTHTSDSIDEVLAKAADEINRNLPMMVDQFTRLESTSPLPQKKMLYKYTILNVSPLPSRDTIIAYVRPKAINNFKTSQDMADMRKMRVTLVYSYADDKGNEIARFEVGPQDIQ